MIYSSHTPYGIGQATTGPAPSDVRRWTRVIRARLRRLFEIWGAPYANGLFPPC